ncbi:hypothetical protein [Pseudomonas putida]|uniref:hypothetical protein n=1 Tax=Pseudomonas putida TaxID=303 RepID=UPI003906BB4A
MSAFFANHHFAGRHFAIDGGEWKPFASMKVGISESTKPIFIPHSGVPDNQPVHKIGRLSRMWHACHPAYLNGHS